MKAIIIILFSFPSTLLAQWNPNTSTDLTSDIQRSGRVAIGLGTPNTDSRLHIKAPSASPFGFVAEASNNEKIIGLGHDGTTGWLTVSYLGQNAYSALGIKTSSLTRVLIDVDGEVGIGTSIPEAKLHINGGHLLLESGAGNATIYTGTGLAELSRYLTLSNSPGLATASGLKAGGILVSDSYSYANPGKNDLVVKGKIAVGTSSAGNFSLYANGNARFGYQATIGHSGDHYDEFAYNVGFTSTNDQYTYVATDAAASIRMGRYGDIEFRTAPAGTAGATLPLTNRMILKENGNVGIGTTTPDAKLTVKGYIHTQGLDIDMLGAVVPDYVFEKNYNLRPLKEVEDFINLNKHLPEIPSAAEMEKNGLDVREMNLLLLKKVEELTLYVIELKKENEKQNEIIQKTSKRKKNKQ